MSGLNLSSVVRPGQVLGVDVPGHEQQPARPAGRPRCWTISVCSAVSCVPVESKAMITSYRARLYHLVAGVLVRVLVDDEPVREAGELPLRLVEQVDLPLLAALVLDEQADVRLVAEELGEEELDVAVRGRADRPGCGPAFFCTLIGTQSLTCSLSGEPLALDPRGDGPDLPLALDQLLRVFLVPEHFGQLVRRRVDDELGLGVRRLAGGVRRLDRDADRALALRAAGFRGRSAPSGRPGPRRPARR